VNGRILDLSRAAAMQLGMERGGLAHVQVEIVGKRRPELLQLSEALSGRAASFLHVNTGAGRPMPLMTSWIRVLPSDLWLTRRVRRVPAMLAADHTVHAVAVLATA
jgi:hypothetical protein